MRKIFAHRGASGYAPENTLEAFELAAKQGAHGIELDVHLSADGELVVTHDETIQRVSDGSGHVKEMTVEQLRRYNFAKGHPVYPMATIPTLREVFALVKPTQMEINIEIKNSVVDYPGIEQKCLALADEMGMSERILYSSFHHDSMARLKQMAPSARCGLLYVTMKNAWEVARRLNATALHPHFSALRDPELCRQAHALGLMVNVWTVDRASDIEKAFLAGADIVITNYPDRGLSTLRANA